MIDTSVLLAGLVSNHEHHVLARPHVVAARTMPLPGIVLAEAFARLRGRPFGFDVTTAVSLLAPWRSPDRVLATPADAYVAAFDLAEEFHLGGNVHDLLIAMTVAGSHERLVTLDRRQARIAEGIVNEVVNLLD